MYALIVTVLLHGQIVESEWKTYLRFEECWEAATVIVKHREDIIARCVFVEK